MYGILQLLKNGALLVDVRESDEYEEGHIEGAINSPLVAVDTVKELAVENDVVL